MGPEEPGGLLSTGLQRLNRLSMHDKGSSYFYVSVNTSKGKGICGVAIPSQL